MILFLLWCGLVMELLDYSGIFKFLLVFARVYAMKLTKKLLLLLLLLGGKEKNFKVKLVINYYKQIVTKRKLKLIMTSEDLDPCVLC